jgi:hypothetical protein
MHLLDFSRRGTSQVGSLTEKPTSAHFMNCSNGSLDPLLIVPECDQANDYTRCVRVSKKKTPEDICLANISTSEAQLSGLVLYSNSPSGTRVSYIVFYLRLFDMARGHHTCQCSN